jgi:hypothetical protein
MLDISTSQRYSKVCKRTKETAMFDIIIILSAIGLAAMLAVIYYQDKEAMRRG